MQSPPSCTPSCQTSCCANRSRPRAFYSSAEASAAEALIDLKSSLRSAHGDTFWIKVVEGVATLVGAQCTFISRRVYLDGVGQMQPVPPVNNVLSIALAITSTHDDADAQDADARPRLSTAENVTFTGEEGIWSCLQQDRVCLITERARDVIAELPDLSRISRMAEPAEALIFLPIHSSALEGGDMPQIIGHLGVLWTAAGLARRSLAWPAVEMLCQGVEDAVCHRLTRYLRAVMPPPPEKMPLSAKSGAEAGAVAGSYAAYAGYAGMSGLKPYARSLSHELRTPMQGVVGMLDVMHATVQEETEDLTDGRVRDVFQGLKVNIEIVQDSARRAVEAVDNVVHAYDMNMGVPESPMSTSDDDDAARMRILSSVVSAHVASASDASTSRRGSKRHLTATGDRADSREKRARLEYYVQHPRRASSSSAVPAVASAPLGGDPMDLDADADMPVASSSSIQLPRTGAEEPAFPVLLSEPHPEEHITPGFRLANLRSVLQLLVNDVLKVGGRPESAIAVEIDGGEEIEVRQKTSNGEERVKVVRWRVLNSVPETIIVDERDLTGLISRVLHNAFKFTTAGSIDLTARLSPKGRHVLINVSDTGPGIPEAFMPYLFKPFSKEDDSLTRASEGLGLGLMVAKGLARRLNGDLYAVRSCTEGPNRGTEFEMKIPVSTAGGAGRMVGVSGVAGVAGLAPGVVGSLPTSAAPGLAGLVPPSSAAVATSVSSASPMRSITSATSVSPSHLRRGAPSASGGVGSGASGAEADKSRNDQPGSGQLGRLHNLDQFPPSPSGAGAARRQGHGSSASKSGSPPAGAAAATWAHWDALGGQQQQQQQQQQHQLQHHQQRHQQQQASEGRDSSLVKRRTSSAEITGRNEPGDVQVRTVSTAPRFSVARTLSAPDRLAEGTVTGGGSGRGAETELESQALQRGSVHHHHHHHSPAAAPAHEAPATAHPQPQIQAPTPTPAPAPAQPPTPTSALLPPPPLPLPLSRPTTPPRSFNRHLAAALPLSFLVVEDNLINRRLLVSMLRALGYADIREAYDGADALRVMREVRAGGVKGGGGVDVILMDLWMPVLNGYEAAEAIRALWDDGRGMGVGVGSADDECGDARGGSSADPDGHRTGRGGARAKGRGKGKEKEMAAAEHPPPKVLAVTADVTDEAVARVARAAMFGPLAKPFKLLDLEKSLLGMCGAGGGKDPGGA